MESKNEKFKRLAEARTNQILAKLKILGNCSNRSVYSYDEDEVNKIFSAIENAIPKIKSQFKVAKKKNNPFKL